MDLHAVMTELEGYASPQTKKVMERHGLPSTAYGVKVEDLKKIVKKVKVNHALALQLYATGISDAMYLAGLIADPKQVTPEQLSEWAKQAPWYMISEFTVAGVAAESPHGWSLGLEWIEHPSEHIQAAGWATLSGWVSVRADNELDLTKLRELLERVRSTIHQAPNRVRYVMNGFVIGVGIYVLPLVEQAKAVASEVGKVQVDMGGTACKVPYAPEYILKCESMGRLGKKRKQVRC